MDISHPNIRELSLEEIKAFFISKGEKGYRAKQVWEWLWKMSAHSFEEMSNLSKETRQLLEENFSIRAVEIDTFQISSDGTIKVAFRLFDGNIVEGVLIPSPPAPQRGDQSSAQSTPKSQLTPPALSAEEPPFGGQGGRMTACVSSQVGCSLTCTFCATGRLERIRNLNAGEIFDQVSLINQLSLKHYQAPLTNIVYMGMGEPLLNYQNVVRSTERINAQDGLNMSLQRLTVSTAGISKMIIKLADDGTKFNLALSLHAANDEKRNKIMPINEHNNLAALAEALRYYYEKTGKYVTYEYIVFNNFNDELNDARELAAFAKIIPCKINLIEYNPIDGSSFLNAKADKITTFKDYLHGQGFVVNIRRSRGKDIDAACGQLANKNEHAVVKLKKAVANAD